MRPLHTRGRPELAVAAAVQRPAPGSAQIGRQALLLDLVPVQSGQPAAGLGETVQRDVARVQSSIEVAGHSLAAQDPAKGGRGEAHVAGTIAVGIAVSLSRQTLDPAPGREVQVGIAEHAVDIEGLGRTPAGVEGAGEGLAVRDRAVVADPGLVLAIADAAADDQLIGDLDVQAQGRALGGEAAVALARRVLTAPVDRTGGPQADQGTNTNSRLSRRVQTVIACSLRG
ncbi:hypothetical protein D3C87_1394380 [compost metagenome]